MGLSPDEIAGLFSIMEGRFNADKAVGLDAIFQFELVDDDGEAHYWVKISDQSLEMQAGTSDAANATFIASPENYAAVVHGETNAMQSFMQGKLKVKGDMGLAMKLQGIFGL